MIQINSKLLLIAVIGLVVVASGCTGGQDVTPIVKALPEVQQFMKEHPNAKITVTYWSKEEVAQSAQEISQQCDKPITPVAMYKATVSEEDLKIVSWINAENKMVICSATEGKQSAPSTPTATATPVQPIITQPVVSTTTAQPMLTPATVTVEIKGFAFNPATITIEKGTAVTWTNKDGTSHTVTGIGNDINSQILSQGQTYSFTSNDAGTFEYQCHIHPSMRGKVIVTTFTTIPNPTTTSNGISVEVLKSPVAAVAGQSFEVSWRVNSPVQKNIPHTAVHYGQESKSEPLTLKSYPSLTTPKNGTIPAEFSANITINKVGVTYFRAHAIIDGANYWSEEKMITISAPANVSTMVTQSPTAAATTSKPYGY